MSGAQDTITVWLEGDPVGKARARIFAQAGEIIRKTPGATKRIENAIKIMARVEMRGRPPLVGPLRLVMRAGYPIPASWSKKKQAAAIAGEIRPTVRPDLDNVAKLWADALLKIAYADDSQLVEIHLAKTYMLRPVTICSVMPLDIAAAARQADESALIAAAGAVA